MPAATKCCPVLADVKAPRCARTLRASALTSSALRVERHLRRHHAVLRIVALTEKLYRPIAAIANTC